MVVISQHLRRVTLADASPPALSPGGAENYTLLPRPQDCDLDKDQRSFKSTRSA